jgi:RNA polymerase sigma-70 factor (ECF subfamily)
MDAGPGTDQGLAERVSSRDPSALDALYERYARPVYSLAVRILRDAALAEDVTQEVFLKLWWHPETYQPQRGSLGAWLLSVTHNRAIDVVRRRQLRESRLLPEIREGEELVADGVVDLGDLAGLQEASAAIRRALTQIPAPQRQAIEMAFFEGKTHAEISAELGEPLGTAKTRIRLGMRKLRALLEDEGIVAGNE